MNMRMDWIFKLGCISMISLIGIGARYGHTGQLTPVGTQQFNKAQFYHFVNSKKCII